MEMKKSYPLKADSPLVQKILVFLPIGILTMSMIAMNNSMKNLLNFRLEEVNMPGIYAIMTTLLSLSTTIAGPIGGKLSDVLGRKKTALIGVGLYAIATFLLGTVPNVAVMLAAYVVLGLAFGTVNPLSSSMVADVMDKDDVPAFIGYAQGLMSFGSIIIPYFSGWLSGMFAAGTAINSLLIFSILSWVAILALYPDMKTAEGEKKHDRFDWAGLALMFFFVAPLSIGLTLGGKQIPWLSIWSLLLYLCAVICLCLFVRRMKTAENALINIKMFSIKGFIPVILIVMLSNPTVTLIGSYLIKYAQGVLGFTAAQTGAWSVRRFVPVILSPLIGYWLSKSLNKNKNYKIALVVGGFVEILSVALLFLCLKEGTPGWLILLSLCLFQGGAAFENSPTKALVASSMPIDMRGSGLAIQNYSATCVATIYTAVAGVLYNSLDFTTAMVWMIGIALVCLCLRQIIAFTKLNDLNL
ncbi:MFS transporter [Hominifimenecus sp. rT4P-3]|uniref:MFS transporter n=1 Tax=Hominifimenecus sp. rT4P-3 TaxID=3242979 RepID=UPI003DA56122